MIPYSSVLREAIFLRRENRFRARVEVTREELAAHVPNSGRLGELLVAGAKCYITLAPDGERRTDCDLRLVQHGEVLVSIDARLPNTLLTDALSRGALPAFHGYTNWQRERAWGDSRFDFAAVTPLGAPAWVETKSVTLIEDGIARFPDAPTARGARHLATLAQLAQDGHDASVVFAVQRADVHAFGPHPTADPRFAAALAGAARQGVRVLAYRCEVTLQGMAITAEIPVLL